MQYKIPDTPFEAALPVVRKLVETALSRGYLISVFDGEEWPLKRSSSFDEVMDAAMATDDEAFRFRRPDGELIGTMTLLYENGEEVISDYTDNDEMTSLAADAVVDLPSERFPSALGYGVLSRTEQEQFLSALEKIDSAVKAGEIRNVDYQSAKRILGRAAEKTWEHHVSKRFFYGMNPENLLDRPVAVRNLFDDINMGWDELHRIESKGKKLDPFKADNDPAVRAMFYVYDEFRPVADALAALKDKVVKGRAPSTTPPPPENPNKVVKTCACCYRKIAVVQATGLMAHHGYRRPGDGYQTASCPGVRFRPLEVSNEGLVWYTDALKDELAKAQRALVDSAALKTLSVQHSPRSKPEVINKDETDPLRWNRYFSAHVARLESRIRGLTREIEGREQILAEWKPESSEYDQRVADDSLIPSNGHTAGHKMP